MTFCQHCLIQDGQLTAIYSHNLFWAITRYWIEILTLNFVCWHFKIKTYDFLSRFTSNFMFWSYFSKFNNFLINGIHEFHWTLKFHNFAITDFFTNFPNSIGNFTYEKM